MTVIKWLLSIAKSNPILFSVALLLIGLSGMVSTVRYQQGRYDLVQNERDIDRREYARKLDSVIGFYNSQKDQLNAETKAMLNTMLEDYKKQLDQQREINRRIDNTIVTNARILQQNTEQLKTIGNEN